MTIKELPAHDRPRERLIHQGVDHLSNEELLMILIKSGCAQQNVREVADLLLKASGSLRNLVAYPYEQLLKVPGIGMAKACELMASFEIGRRAFHTVDTIYQKKITNAELVFQFYQTQFQKRYQECFCCLYLDEAKKVIASRQLFVGTLNQSLVHPREIFKEAYLLSASSFICIHNHPSNQVSPSKEDIELTERLKMAGSFLGVPILDHIIIGKDCYYSFLEHDQIF